MSHDSSLPKIIIVLVVVVLLVAVGAPSFVGRNRGGSWKNVCISNLKQIQGAIEQWALETKRSTNDLVSITDIAGSPTNYIKQLINKELKCPSGGSYSVTTIGEVPRCSVAGHTL